MSAVLVIDQNWVALVAVVLVSLVVVFAITQGRPVEVWFRKILGIRVGEPKKTPPAKPDAADQKVSVANQSKISDSNVNIHVGDSVNYPSPERGEEPPRK
jgi:hypothetical protein